MADSRGKRVQNMRRHGRVRAKIFGRADRPRLVVFRSNQHLYAQLVDDKKGSTLVAASDLELGKDKRKNRAVAREVGKLMGKKALHRHIRRAVFDRRGYAYHGNVKALAEGAREGGLTL